MTQEQATTELFNNYHYLTRCIANRTLKQDKYGLASKGDKQARLDLYLELVDSKLLNPGSAISLYNYKLPTHHTIDSKEALLNDYLTGYYTNIHPFIFAESNRKYKNNIKYIPYSKLSEEGQSMFDNQEDTYQFVETIIDQGMQSLLEGIIARFSEHLNSIDKQILVSKLASQSNEHIEKLTNLSTRTINDRYNEIGYRLLAFIVYEEILPYSDDYLIKAFNQYKSFNKKYLFVTQIDKVPNKNQLRAIFRKEKSHKWEKDSVRVDRDKVMLYPTLSEQTVLQLAQHKHDRLVQLTNKQGDDPSTPILKSSKDYQGNRHKRYCTFINAQGWAYDHVNQVSWFLGE